MKAVMPISAADLPALNTRFASVGGAQPLEIIHWAAENFPKPDPAGRGGIVMTSSFGADAMCTIHLATRVLPDIPIIVVNTGYLFPETLNFLEEMRLAYNLNIREYKTKNEPLVWLS